MYGVYPWPLDLYLTPQQKFPDLKHRKKRFQTYQTLGIPNAMDPSGWEVSKVDRSKLKVGFP